MSSLRLEFETLQKSKYVGSELLFEICNDKYIRWLEQNVAKLCNMPNAVSQRELLLDINTSN